MQIPNYRFADLRHWLLRQWPFIFTPFLVIGCCKPAEFPHSPDRDFVTVAATVNQDGMAAGNLGGEKASDPAVRVFGNLLAHDDSTAELALLQLADTINLLLPTAPDGQYDSLAILLSGQSGRSFDLTWLRSESGSLRLLTALYQGELDNGQSATVQRFARDWLPAVQRDQRTADSLLTLQSLQ